MDGLRNPIGDLPPEVYWKRRLFVGLTIVIVILVIWVLIAAATGGSDKKSAATPDPSVDPTISVSPGATDQPDSIRACGADDVVITTVANPASVPEGALPVFDVAIAHQGSTACSLDTAAEGTELLITSGSDRIFSSLDCPDDATIAAKQLILAPDATEDLSVTWNRQRSLPECAPESAIPGAGTYKASLTIQGIKSELATFTLE